MEDGITQTVREKFLVMERVVDERTKRLWAATEARAAGRGGVTRVAEATGMSRSRIHAGLREIDSAGSEGVLLDHGELARVPAGSAARRW